MKNIFNTNLHAKTLTRGCNPLLNKISWNSFLLFILTVVMITGLTSCKKENPAQDLLSVVKQRGTILAGVKFDSKPFGFIDTDQKLKGFDVDLVKEIAKRILGDENAVKFQQVTSSNRIFSLSTGSVDLVAATLTINPKRRQVIDFSSPYYIAGQAIMIPEKSNIKSVRNLNGRKVIVVLGSTSEKNIRELAPKAMVEGYRTYTDAFSALRAGRADALTTDDTIITGFLAENPNFRMINERYTRELYGIGFKKSNDTQSFQNAVNTALEGIKADGTLELLRKKWIQKYNR
ncbi:MAG: glutamate ABC transporter substrate-binding protein [Candidatus Gastranaerophilales bacterium]|nr:glutamate ABC transporter substrate-binding protein [Candidatus Gastranaerophilales bacterium]